MDIVFARAERRKAKIRVAISGPSGSGKTMSSIFVAQGLNGNSPFLSDGKTPKTVMIDTENGSGELYANIMSYDIFRMREPYSPDRYIEAIHAAEKAGYETIIIDSISHEWSGVGGCLELQQAIASRNGGNSFSAWKQITPLHQHFIDAMLQSSCNIIATMRSKTDYVQTNGENGGKRGIQKVGMAPVQRDGMEYEFTVMFELDSAHNAVASKDRTQLFDKREFVLSKDIGDELKKWMETGKDPLPVSKKVETSNSSHPTMSTIPNINHVVSTNLSNSPKSNDEESFICADCKKTITPAENDYSKRIYGKPLCRDCQKKNTKLES